MPILDRSPIDPQSQALGWQLAELGFQLEEYLDNVDEGGPVASVVFYRSSDSKIQVYDSAWGGEINCMITPLDCQHFWPLRPLR